MRNEGEIATLLRFTHRVGLMVYKILSSRAPSAVHAGRGSFFPGWLFAGEVGISMVGRFVVSSILGFCFIL